MPLPRASGILLHPTSFPSRFGIGDLGKSAYEFIDFLVAGKQRYWQILPLGPTGFGNSPYMCFSAMAGNPLMLSLEKLYHNGFLTGDDLLKAPDFPPERVDFQQVVATKMPLLEKACDSFKNSASPGQHKDFARFCESKAYWLDNYALFMALLEVHQGASWHTWEKDIARREPEAVDRWRSQLSNQIFFQKYIQFEFFHQWQELKAYANQGGIEIIGDIPIYVAHNSADVWAYPENFRLDEETGEPALMAGVPPDYFSETGQLWGNPVYDWQQLEQDNYGWWVQRFQSILDYVDLIRIDHFRGFEGYWVVPQGETTAMNGAWLKGPGAVFFEAIKQQLGRLPIIAEDLGVITPEVEALRDRFEFPGMKILQFAFGGGAGNPYLPFNYTRNSVVYSGTHDNDTTGGWFEQLSDGERQTLIDYLGGISADGVHWDLIRLAYSSISNLAIIPVQDLLGLGNEARMNYPGTATGNWEWRYQEGHLQPQISDRLQNLGAVFGRLPS
ncbi:4-alpha-glucanotransferase [Merismopedia glauca]|uniref:4-alpha-glucanotransferase n=1 Tax=Merismopedia glauca CCAP 1448/3 TaxID=1296344 RepID=A0A2T1C8P9_9CYAN|nr:4-alpha-glucanotransferase [Merismopedia glauca]PSB04662.1 4-alpha-glucanotransferase [Merismopedia glauca CCAP 1448/3]